MGGQSIADIVLNPDNIVAFVAALACFGVIVMVVGPLLGTGKLDKRLKNVANRREQLRKQNRAELAKGGRRTLREVNKGFMKDVVERLNLIKLLEDPNLSKKMMQAGLRGQRPIFMFYFFRFLLPFVMFFGAMFYLFLVNDHGQQPIMRFCISFVAAFIGYYLPGMYISNIAQKRRDSIMQAFPDALDLLLICVEAGMSIEAAIQKVAGEVGAQSIELAEEMSLTVAELSYLQERRQAYENLANRTNHPGVKAVCTALIQSERYGTPLGNALRIMAKENRDMRMAAAEKKAAALPAKLTVPMIVFFLPVLFVVILGPAIIKFQQMG